MDNYLKQCAGFETLLDFFRFGVSKARAHELHFGHGTDNAWDDIMALILGSVHLPYDADAMLLNARVTDEEREHLATCLSKRILDRVPVPYLTHEALFCDLPFYVDERVLIPRSPVAELIKTQFEPWINCEKVTSILDLCTGSGCIAIACCYAFPEAAVDAVDLSKEALVVAELNRQKLGVEAQLELIQSDCFDEIPAGKRYNVIISNPPYVGLDELESLPKEYAHEPRLALWADRNGLEIVERILNSAASYLHDEGILIVEVGASDALLSETYPEVPFTWLDFAEGGEGVFLLTKAQLLQYFNSKN